MPPSTRGSPSVSCLGSRLANAHNSSISNKFANDGSFLQQFLKLQKAQTSTGECGHPPPVSCLGSPVSSLPVGVPGHLRNDRSLLKLVLLISHSLSAFFLPFPILNSQGESTDPTLKVLTL